MAQDLRTAGPRDTHLYEFLGTRRQPAVFSIYSRWSLLLTTATILGLTALATIGFRHQSETLSHAFRRPKSHESALTNSDTAVLDADDPFRMEDDTYGVPYLAEQEAYESFDSLRYDDPATVDNIAIAIKISRETVKTRLAPILGTYADRFKHRIYVSDHQDSIGSTPVFDVYNGIYEESLQILKQRKIEYAMYKPPNRGLQTDGWERDAEKFLPGFKRLYETFPESDWFLVSCPLFLCKVHGCVIAHDKYRWSTTIHMSLLAISQTSSKAWTQTMSIIWAILRHAADAASITTRKREATFIKQEPAFS